MKELGLAVVNSVNYGLSDATLFVFVPSGGTVGRQKELTVPQETAWGGGKAG